ncbi:helix-turn-helix domain-containing protein [Amedibacillus sp. YH-ame6]
MISQNLMILRKKFRFSLEEVAERIGVSRHAVTKWETGETVPDLHNCKSLADLYGVTIDDLVSFDSKENNLHIPPKGKHCFGTVKVGERGQIVIPKKARNLFDMKAGDDLLILGDEEQGLALVKADVFLKFAQEILKGGNESHGGN